MPREKEGFRDQLERLDEQFPGREYLTISETAKLTKMSRETILSKKPFPVKRVSRSYLIYKVPLARWMV